MTINATILGPVQDLGDIGARFRKARILHAPGIQIFDALDVMRRVKRDAPDEAQDAGTLFGVSHSGKTIVFNMYLATRVVDYCLANGDFPPGTPRSTVLKNQRRVLYFELPAKTTMGSFFTILLKRLGDPNPSEGTLDKRQDRAYTLLEALGVELIIIDEIDHLRKPVARSHANRTDAMTVHNQLKELTNKGIPVMFVGIPEAKEKLFDEQQLKNREMISLELNPLRMKNPKDREIYKEFCGHWAVMMVEKLITKEFSRVLVDEEVLYDLCEATGGLFGMTAKTLRKAAEFMFLEGASCVERHHLALGVDAFAIGRSCKVNPFTRRDKAIEKEMQFAA